MGARPQFVKAAVVSRAIRASDGLREVLVHTGQHHDAAMSQVFFDELGIARPELNLGISGGTHGEQTGRMLASLEKVIEAQTPDWVLVYGDTNSTLAAALAAAKLCVAVAHVEAGLRSYNRLMPEEINRVVADHLSSHLFSPTDLATSNLLREGKDQSDISQVGDVMLDATVAFSPVASNSGALNRLGLKPGEYVLATIHRQENVDDEERFGTILKALGTLNRDIAVVLPLHPRARRQLDLQPWQRANLGDVRIIEPVGYLEMLALERGARLIMTDSGGVQKEAFFQGVPCITLRTETEWTELVDAGWNVVVPPRDATEIVDAAKQRLSGSFDASPVAPYGDGRAAERVAQFFRERSCSQERARYLPG